MHYGLCVCCGKQRMVSDLDGKCFDCGTDPRIEEDLKKLKEVMKMGSKNSKEKTNEKQSLKVTVDFSDRKDLYDGLAEMARQDFRTPELEILWLVNEALKNRQQK